MDLRRLGLFLAVVDHGGFTAAGKAVHVAQPAISLAVRELEAELGAVLLVRSRKGAVLTSAGRALVEPARTALRDIRTAAAAVAAVTGLIAGQLDLVSLPSLAADPLAGMWRDFGSAISLSATPRSANSARRRRSRASTSSNAEATVASGSGAARWRHSASSFFHSLAVDELRVSVRARPDLVVLNSSADSDRSIRSTRPSRSANWSAASSPRLAPESAARRTSRRSCSARRLRSSDRGRPSSLAIAASTFALRRPQHGAEVVVGQRSARFHPPGPRMLRIG